MFGVCSMLITDNPSLWDSAKMKLTETELYCTIKRCSDLESYGIIIVELP